MRWGISPSHGVPGPWAGQATLELDRTPRERAGPSLAVQQGKERGTMANPVLVPFDGSELSKSILGSNRPAAS